MPKDDDDGETFTPEEFAEKLSEMMPGLHIQTVGGEQKALTLHEVVRACHHAVGYIMATGDGEHAPAQMMMRVSAAAEILEQLIEHDDLFSQLRERVELERGGTVGGEH